MALGLELQVVVVSHATLHVEPCNMITGKQTQDLCRSSHPCSPCLLKVSKMKLTVGTDLPGDRAHGQKESPRPRPHSTAGAAPVWPEGGMISPQNSESSRLAPRVVKEAGDQSLHPTHQGVIARSPFYSSPCSLVSMSQWKPSQKQGKSFSTWHPNGENRAQHTVST